LCRAPAGLSIIIKTSLAWDFTTRAWFVSITTARRALARARFLAFLTGIVLSQSFFAGTMGGQVRTGNIYGRITDEDGLGLPQVKVTLSAPEFSPLSTAARPSGLYWFASLSPGSEYVITAELEGYKKATRTGLVVQVGVNTECNITLERLSAVVSKWRAAKVAFKRLVEDPSALTTRDFYLSLSEEIEEDKTEILDYIFGPDISEFMPGVGRFTVIVAEMLNGDIYAARAAIRILGYVKREWQKPPSQKLPILLRIGGSVGTLIRANPSLFLRACLEERESPGLKERDIPYGSPPFILYMKRSMLSYEMEMRKEAVQSVDDPQLQFVRDECLDLIEKGTQVFEAYAVERPRPWESTATELDEAPEAVKSTLLEMMARPDAENMKRVLALFDERREEHRFLEAALFPLISISGPNGPEGPPRDIRPDPLEIIFHEAKCGNPCAIQIVFTALLRAFRAWDDLASQELFGFISDLILMNPAVFIENVAKFTYLESERLDTAPITYLDAICDTIDFHAYPDQKARETILRRRIAALGALTMPEHKVLIDRCIRLIEKHLK
jgi:hypothetical protein